MDPVKRRYRQTVRADHVAATRRRIVEAAVALHSTVGPANTTLSAVAREAGVSRPTLYAHFPDEATLFQACTMHSIAQSPPPDPRAWSTIDEPRDRIRTAMTELYTYYARNEQMLENVFRDMYVVESMREFNVPLVEASFEHMTQVLTSCFGDAPTSARRRAALVALALSFDTWHILARDRALTDDEAAELMTTMAVTSVA